MSETAVSSSRPPTIEISTLGFPSVQTCVDCGVLLQWHRLGLALERAIGRAMSLALRRRVRGHVYPCRPSSLLLSFWQNPHSDNLYPQYMWRGSVSSEILGTASPVTSKKRDGLNIHAANSRHT